MLYGILALIGASFALCFIFTALVKRTARAVGFVDKPGHRKIHSAPKALGGGIAIFMALALPMAGTLIYVNLADAPIGHAEIARHWAGLRAETPLALWVLGALAAMHVLGLVDDHKALGPYSKLVVQMGIITALVVSQKLAALTVLGPVASTVVTVLWIAGITNAFNFLDNMDGLSAGVGAVSAAAFLATTLLIEQWFVAAMLALLLGALLAFLCFNFNPATIFMGDSGSLVIGLLLGILTVRTTYLPHDRPLAAGWYAVLAPLIVLAVPLYDLLVVSTIRIRNGRSPFKGDTNHLSHRLVARGMSRRTAVVCIYIMTGATSIAAILLTRVESTLGAMLIIGQTVMVLGLVALLEQHPLPAAAEAGTTASGPGEVAAGGAGDLEPQSKARTP